MGSSGQNGQEPPEGRAPDLPFRIELWDGEGRRVLAIAAQRLLAQAIFTAAQREHPGALVVLSRDGTVLDQSRQA
jgi:hypothetical protein